MSDPITTQQDPAIEAIDDQVRQLDIDILASSRRIEVDTAIRDRLLELRATLSRKPRARRTRAAVEPVIHPAGYSSVDKQREAADVASAALPPPAWAGFAAIPSAGSAD